MKRKEIHILYIAVLSIMPGLLSCDKLSADVSTEQPPIEFSVGEFDASVDTKAVEVTTANLTSIYVTGTTGTSGTGETSKFTSTNFTGTSGGTFSGGKYWTRTEPSGGYHFYASNIGNSFSSNNCTVSANTDTDVVCAYIENPTFKGSNPLTFNHIFARIGTVSVYAASTYSISGVTVRITPKTSGIYNIRSGNGYSDGTGWSAVSNGSETTLSLSSNNALYLIPGSYSLTVTYTLTKGDWTHEYTKTATVNIQAGVTNNISMTTPTGSAVEIIATVSLSAWGTNNISGSFS